MLNSGPYPMPTNPDEAIRYMEWRTNHENLIRERGEQFAWIIPLYAEDGVTIIGEFGVGG